MFVFKSVFLHLFVYNLFSDEIYGNIVNNTLRNTHKGNSALLVNHELMTTVVC